MKIDGHAEVGVQCWQTWDGHKLDPNVGHPEIYRASGDNQSTQEKSCLKKQSLP